MNRPDLQLEMKLLRGKLANPIKLSNGIELTPLTMGEIEDVGFENYNRHLYNLVRDISDLNFTKSYDNFVYFDFLVGAMFCGSELDKQEILSSFEFFLKTKVKFDFDENKICFVSLKEKIDINGNIITEEYIINQLIFTELVGFLKNQNCVLDKKADDMKVASAKAEEIKRKILQGRAKMNKNQKNDITINDLISTLSANGQNGINIFNVWDLTFYQFNDQFNRMKMIDDYFVNIRYLLAGTEASKLDLKHYLSPISK